MPVLEATDFTPHGARLPHRPIGEDSTGPGKEPHVTNITPPVVKRASRQQPGTADADSEVDEWQRAAEDDASSKRSTQAPVRRASAITGPKTLPKTPKPKASALGRAPKRHVHPLLYLGLGMLVMLALWTGLMELANWFNTTMDDLRYGYPRTFQMDQFVGHNESGGTPSHFIAINFHSHIDVIEFPGGDATYARIFIGPQLYTDGSDLAPVTLKFLDVNSDHRPDMMIEFEGSQVAFINDQGMFRPLRPQERPKARGLLAAPQVMTPMRMREGVQHLAAPEGPFVMRGHPCYSDTERTRSFSTPLVR